MKQRNFTILLAGVALAAVLSGCQKNPDSSIVKNKDFDKLIDQAKDENNGVSDTQQVAENYDTYKNSFSDESLGVSVNVDVQVDIPQTDKLSIFRVKQKNISQEFLHKIKEKFMSEDKLYDAAATDAQTKRTIEQSMKESKSQLDEAKQAIKDGEMEEEDLKVYQKEYDDTMKELEEQYETAPDKVDLENYKSDGKFHKTSEFKDKNDFYNWVYDLNENGEVFCGINKGENGIYKSLYAQNNENYGNCLRYRESRSGYIWNWSSMADVSIQGKEMYSGDGGEYMQFKENELTISEDDAKILADAFISEEGLDDYKMYSCEKKQSVEDLRNGGDATLDNIYLITYMRNINGAFVLPNSGKFQEGWQGQSYVKKVWPIEEIVIQVTDDGIIGVDYASPIETVDTVVEGATLKQFDEIKGIFENMVVAMYADEELKREIKVDSVKLGYAIISEEGTFDTGLLVPVWDFNGTVNDSGRIDETSIMTINAIDGTVIDRGLGY